MLQSACQSRKSLRCNELAIRLCIARYARVCAFTRAGTFFPLVRNFFPIVGIFFPVLALRASNVGR